MKVIKKIYDFITYLINWLYIYSSSWGNTFILPIGIVFIITIVPIVNFFHSLYLIFSTSNSAQSLSIISDLFGIFSIILSYVLVIQKGYTFHTKYTTFIEEIKTEIQTIMPLLDKLGLDLESNNILSAVSDKMAHIYFDLFEKYSDINAFGFQFYKDLSLFTSKTFKLDGTKSKFLDFIIFSNKFEYYSRFIRDEKNNSLYVQEGSDYFKVLVLLYDYYSRHEENEIYNIPTIDISQIRVSNNNIAELYNDLFLPEKSSFYRSLTSNIDEKLANNILKYAIKESYTVLSYDNKSKKIIGPVLILKNEESFETFWDKIDRDAKDILKNRKNPPSEEEIEKYTIKKEKLLKDFSKNPFSYALKKDPYIFPALDKNAWSPVFIFDSDRLPIGYRNEPIKYIEKVIKKEADNYQKRMFKTIRKIFPEMNFGRELIFDYEIIPFNPENISIHTRPDKTPSSFQNLLVTNIILNKDKNKFITAKIVQIQSILKYISPFSLIIDSVETLLLEKFKSIEPDFLKEIGKKKNGKLSWEGIGNIIGSNKSKLANVLYDVAKKELNLNYFSKIKCKEIINEIINNANIINQEITQKNANWVKHVTNKNMEGSLWRIT